MTPRHGSKNRRLGRTQGWAGGSPLYPQAVPPEMHHRTGRGCAPTVGARTLPLPELDLLRPEGAEAPTVVGREAVPHDAVHLGRLAVGALALPQALALAPVPHLERVKRGRVMGSDFNNKHVTAITKQRPRTAGVTRDCAQTKTKETALLLL